MRGNVALDDRKRIVRTVEEERRHAVGAALEELARSLPTEPSVPFRQAAEELGRLISRPGKRIRPYLCVLGYDSSAVPGQARPEGVTTFAAALELLHVFLLVHDDVADRADSRRGGPALHVNLRPSGPALPESERRHLGDQLAIVAGDWLYTRAIELMLTAPGLEPDRRARAVQHVLQICRSTAEGQYADLALSARPVESTQRGDVLEVYRLKTARYTFEGPLLAGAHLAGASDAAADALVRFSKHAGIAFQLQDDLLGLLASEEATGKPPLADLREGKKTWPLLTMRARIDTSRREWLDRLLTSRNADVADLALVRILLRSSGALSETLDEIDRHCDAAMDAIRSTTVAAAHRELIGLLEWVRDSARQWR